MRFRQTHRQVHQRRPSKNHVSLFTGLQHRGGEFFPQKLQLRGEQRAGNAMAVGQPLIGLKQSFNQPKQFERPKINSVPLSFQH